MPEQHDVEIVVAVHRKPVTPSLGSDGEQVFVVVSAPDVWFLNYAHNSSRIVDVVIDGEKVAVRHLHTGDSWMFQGDKFGFDMAKCNKLLVRIHNVGRTSTWEDTIRFGTLEALEAAHMLHQGEHHFPQT